MKKYEFMKEVETRQKEKARLEAIRRINIVRNPITKGSKMYNYEISKEFYLLEPHYYNDLYNQN